VRDGAGVLPLNQCNLNAGGRNVGRVKKVDWLTTYCKQRKKESPAILTSKAARPKKKVVPKEKINNR
jgi:hypothetical protein